jgi:RND family efflux transporter MFP subunit
MGKKLIMSTLLVIVVIFSSCKTETKEAKEVIKYVKVETVKSTAENTNLVFNGVIKEKSLTSLSFRVGGPLKTLTVKEGDFVKKGDLIAAIDQRDYKLQLQSTKAQYLQLKGEYSRYKELFEEDKIPANSYEKIESGFLMAKTAFENAENQLKDTELRAPFSGYIHEKMTENFQTVGAGQPIVSIIDVSNLEVQISIPENQLLKIKNSQNNFLSVDQSGVSNLPLEIISISEKAGNDGMYQMKLGFKNDENLQVFPGMTAEVHMICGSKEAGIQIPSSAIFHKNDQNYVWLYETHSQQIKKQAISIKTLNDNGMVEISSGLNHKDTIVSAGVHHLSEGQKVQLIQKSSKSNVGGLL